MNDKEFNVIIRELNLKYREIFNCIPRITDYSCTREEYIAALHNSIENKKEIKYYLVAYTKLNNNKLEI